MKWSVSEKNIEFASVKDLKQARGIGRSYAKGIVVLESRMVGEAECRLCIQRCRGARRRPDVATMRKTVGENSLQDLFWMGNLTGRQSEELQVGGKLEGSQRTRRAAGSNKTYPTSLAGSNTTNPTGKQLLHSSQASQEGMEEAWAGIDNTTFGPDQGWAGVGQGYWGQWGEEGKEGQSSGAGHSGWQVEDRRGSKVESRSDNEHSEVGSRREKGCRQWKSEEQRGLSSFPTWC